MLTNTSLKRVFLYFSELRTFLKNYFLKILTFPEHTFFDHCYGLWNNYLFQLSILEARPSNSFQTIWKTNPCQINAVHKYISFDSLRIFGINIVTIPLFSKQFSPITSILYGRLTYIKLMHYENTLPYKYLSCIPSSKITLFKLAHLENAQHPISSTLFGINTSSITIF